MEEGDKFGRGCSRRVKTATSLGEWRLWRMENGKGGNKFERGWRLESWRVEREAASLRKVVVGESRRRLESRRVERPTTSLRGEELSSEARFRSHISMLNSFSAGGEKLLDDLVRQSDRYFRQKMHLVALLVFHLDMLETMYTMLVLVGSNALNIRGRRRAAISYAKAISENSTDELWKWFKNCLGALDGTYIKVHVPAADILRYWSRKSEIATNVLGVCTPDMQFIYVLAGWEGFAADGRVLRDAITRRN
ncbi:hypothetical protein Pint_33022 [Pistacia integerrima]|uniref:Uncharacterized protein n=1 Tax=Pistacia integerrima TaxID=434235 RepID=A0ACC0X749_9ROSI|nr:hypothetical protein Pint_33022 [Pistacia integerrima]